MKTPAELELCGFDVFDEVPVERAGAADEHVNRPERGGDLARGALALGGLRQIRGDRMAALAEPRGELRECRAVARDETDARPQRRELLGAGAADASRGAGHEHRLASEITHHDLRWLA